jgi:HK97 gp10 family phage protein
MANGITVRGIPEVQRNLANFPRVLVLGCFQKALARASAVFEAELASRTPEADSYTTSSEEYGTLLENLTSAVTIDTQGRGGKASIGFGRKGFVAMFVEYGHQIAIGGKLTRKGITGPGRKGGFVPAHPFMRPAFEAAAERAVDVFIETVKEYMSDANVRVAA